MALIKCPECGKQYSDKAKACPNCGYQPKKSSAPIAMTITGVMSICIREIDSEWGPLICMAICLGAAYIGAVLNTAYKDILAWSLFIMIFSFIYLGIGIFIKTNRVKH